MELDFISKANILNAVPPFYGFKVSNGHSPQIRQNGELLVRMCRGESHFSQKWRMSNVSKCIESGEMVGECRANVSSPGKMVGECWANVSSPGKVGWQMSAQAR
jgi:hypothetical protein